MPLTLKVQKETGICGFFLMLFNFLVFNLVAAGQSRHFEQRPQSKSSTKVQETLKSLCDTPVLLDGEEELNNVVGGRLNSRLGGGEQDSYPPGHNRTKCE